MKRLTRNMLGLMMIAWCLLLNDYEVLGMFVVILIGVYGLYNIKISNYWRVISLFLILNLLTYLSLSTSNLTTIYSLLLPFMVVMNMNSVLMNEICLKLKKDSITLFFLMISLTMLAFYLVILLLPSISFLPYYKTNLVYLTSYLFLPSFFIFVGNLMWQPLKKNN